VQLYSTNFRKIYQVVVEITGVLRTAILVCFWSCRLGGVADSIVNHVMVVWINASRA
jgi:hypothetical protein